MNILLTQTWKVVAVMVLVPRARAPFDWSDLTCWRTPPEALAAPPRAGRRGAGSIRSVRSDIPLLTTVAPWEREILGACAPHLLSTFVASLGDDE